MHVAPHIRSFVATNAHPIGCAREVERQVARARREPAGWTGGNALVIGASSGYGLATRIVAAFGYGMNTLGVGRLRSARGNRTASAGWYNAAAFAALAKSAGLHALDVRGDAFSAEVLDEALALLKARFGTVDLVVYSVAAPTRTDPTTGVTFRSVVKPIHAPAFDRTIHHRQDAIVPVTVPVATEKEITDTVATMGGDDLGRWVDRLLGAGLLAPKARVIAYSYVGPAFTRQCYQLGTMGRAKAHLEATCRQLDARLRAAVGGRCHVAVNKSVITGASMTIPIFPLYVSTLYAVMKERGVHEDAVDQIIRLFRDHLAPGVEPTLDADGRIRLDDRELADDIQAEVSARWPRIDTANLHALTDWAGCKRSFRQLFGFDVPGVDYAAPVDIDVPLG